MTTNTASTTLQPGDYVTIIVDWRDATEPDDWAGAMPPSRVGEEVAFVGWDEHDGETVGVFLDESDPRFPVHIELYPYEYEVSPKVD